jgi:hypothetical protein
MSDPREAILNRLREIGSGITGVTTALRNVMALSEDRRPAIIVLDADEAAEEIMHGGSRPFDAPTIVVMTPEIFILVSSSAATVGSDLNLVRGRLVKAVLQDAPLKALLGSNGDVRYAGCGTALATGRSMEGEMAMSFALRYALKPAELEA